MSKYLLLSPNDFMALESIKSRLYNDKKLSGDDRRDLANLIFAIIDRSDQLTEEDLTYMQR